MSNRGLSQSKNQHFSDLARSTSTTTLTKCPKSPSTIFPINMKQNVNPHSNINHIPYSKAHIPNDKT